MYLLQLERSTEENTLDLMVRNFLKIFGLLKKFPQPSFCEVPRMIQLTYLFYTRMVVKLCYFKNNLLSLQKGIRLLMKGGNNAYNILGSKKISYNLRETMKYQLRKIEKLQGKKNLPLKEQGWLRMEKIKQSCNFFLTDLPLE